ncbi:MAG: ATP-binding protein [Planctomycetota bacterium]
MIFVWFIYGLAFFVLGLVIFVYPKKASVFSLANHIRLIACFGILHGINEWLDMFIAIGEPFPPDVLKVMRIATLAGSFLFLLRFGTVVIAENRSCRCLIALPPVLFVIWAMITAFSTSRLLIGDIFGRYLLCAPGAILTATALLLHTRQFQQTKLHAALRNMRIAAIAFIFYAVFAGFIVKKATFPPASFLNYDLFMSMVGVPVQIFRAICAVVLAYSVTRLLSIFRWETQEALRRSEHRCTAITSAAPIILFVQDLDSVVTFIQGKGFGLLGLKPADITGHRFGEVFPAVPQLDEDSRRALAGEQFVTRITIRDVIFECCYSPLRDNDGEVTGIIGVFLDVTADVRAQHELEKYRRQMEKDARMVEIGTIGATMAQQLDEPLALTSLLLQRLCSDLAGPSASETVTGSLEKGLSQVSKAVEILDRFRSLAQIPGRTIIAPVDIYQIAKRVVLVFGQSAKRANLKIALKDMPFVPFMSMTARELEQIFFTMIQNAVDAADPDRTQKLVITGHCSERQVELRFADTCGGIEPGKLQNVFDPFFVAGPGARKTGFGLAIAKQIVRTHGGNIVAESEPGQGTTFHVTLQAQRIY